MNNKIPPETEEEILKIKKANCNKVNILLDRNKNSSFIEEYLDDLIRYGFNQGFQAGQNKEREEVLKWIEFYEKTWDEDKDAMFNEGYMDNLFKELKSKLQKEGEKE